MAIIDHFSFYVIFIFSILDDFGFRHLLWGGAQAQKRVDLGGHLHPFIRNKKNTLKKHWLENPSQTSSDRWRDITDELNLTINKGNLPMCENEIILQHAYPRLDKAVSTNINHLLKSPFCVHLKTGKHYHHSDTVEEISLFGMSRIKNNIKKINHKHSIF
nr:10159_t:CDS:2 [Entrophospora candida]